MAAPPSDTSSSRWRTSPTSTGAPSTSCNVAIECVDQRCRPASRHRLGAASRARGDRGDGDMRGRRPRFRSPPGAICKPRAGIARGHRARAAIYALHRWLEGRRLPLAQLTPKLFRQFLMRPHHVRVATKTSRPTGLSFAITCSGCATALISFNPKRLRRNLRVLPPLAHEFLASLAPTLRRIPATATRRRCAAFMCGSTSAGSILSGSRVMTVSGA